MSAPGQGRVASPDRRSTPSATSANIQRRGKRTSRRCSTTCGTGTAEGDEMKDNTEFLARWAAFVRRHADADAVTRGALVHEVLNHGLDAVVPETTAQPIEIEAPERLTCE